MWLLCQIIWPMTIAMTRMTIQIMNVTHRLKLSGSLQINFRSRVIHIHCHGAAWVTIITLFATLIITNNSHKPNPIYTSRQYGPGPGAARSAKTASFLFGFNFFRPDWSRCNIPEDPDRIEKNPAIWKQAYKFLCPTHSVVRIVQHSLSHDNFNEATVAKHIASLTAPPIPSSNSDYSAVQSLVPITNTKNDHYITQRSI